MTRHSSLLTPRSSRDHIAGAFASGAATALFAPARMPAPVRRTMHVSAGLVAGTSLAWALGRPDEEDSGQQAETASTPHQPPPVHLRLAQGTALGALVTASSIGGMWLDSATERSLARRGLRHPRIWMGVAAAAITLALSLAQARLDNTAETEAAPNDTDELRDPDFRG